MCTDKQKKLCKNFNCDICFERSFAALSDKVEFWSDKNDFSARDVCASSHKKAWFDCKICGHVFYKSLYHITLDDRWCPFCSNQKLCDDFGCDICFKKSFAASSRSEFWSHKNEFSPRDISIASG